MTGWRRVLKICERVFSVSSALLCFPVLSGGMMQQRTRFNQYSPQSENLVARYTKLWHTAMKIPAVRQWREVRNAREEVEVWKGEWRFSDLWAPWVLVDERGRCCAGAWDVLIGWDVLFPAGVGWKVEPYDEVCGIMAFEQAEKAVCCMGRLSRSHLTPRFCPKTCTCCSVSAHDAQFPPYVMTPVHSQ